MAKIPAWHSTRKAFVLGQSALDGPDVLDGDPRVYHDNDQWAKGNKIPLESRQSGTHDFPQCDECKSLS